MRQTPAAAYALSTIGWFWSYLALTGLLLALTYQDQLVKREAHVRQLEQLANAAHLRALRYQVNPHFLFNALNSIAGLVSQGDNGTAEAMIEGMGEFFRAGLAINPLDDIPLQIEADLQKLYLDVEKLRFQERLEFSFILSDEARLSLVPSLILQPLMENVVKHAVANSSSRVEVLCEANVTGDRLSIRVANSAPDLGAASTPGTGVELKNVSDRLETRFGSDHSFSATTTADGGIRGSDVDAACEDGRGMIRAFVVDDESFSIQRLTVMLSRFGDVETVERVDTLQGARSHHQLRGRRHIPRHRNARPQRARAGSQGHRKIAGAAVHRLRHRLHAICGGGV